MVLSMRISKRALRVEQDQAELSAKISRLWQEYDLTSIEFLQALASVQQSVLKYMLRSGRNPDNPDREADLEKESP